jgi:solute carrier family 45 protein 1/2/4
MILRLIFPSSSSLYPSIAGPISGLITQPLIGAISDSSTSKYRRRYWVVLSSGLMILSCLMLAYARPLGMFAADIWGVGEGDWDPKWKNAVQKISISIAIIAFYGLDFAVNALVRALSFVSRCPYYWQT